MNAQAACLRKVFGITVLRLLNQAGFFKGLEEGTDYENKLFYEKGESESDPDS